MTEQDKNFGVWNDTRGHWCYLEGSYKGTKSDAERERHLYEGNDKECSMRFDVRLHHLNCTKNVFDCCKGVGGFDPSPPKKEVKRGRRVSAVGLITNDKGQVLLCRLSKVVMQNAGFYTLPGGKNEWSEDPIDTVVREVKEETGLTATVKNLLAIDSTVHKFHDKGEEPKEIHAIRIIYRADVEDGSLVVETGEDATTDHCGWFSVEEANRMSLTSLAKKGLSFLLQSLVYEVQCMKSSV